MSIARKRKITLPLIFLLAICLFILIGTTLLDSQPAHAAVDLYWVGDAGNWSDNTNHWSLSSGGAPGASKPTSADTVYFDSNSFSSGSQTVTLDETAYCLDMDWTGVTNTPTLAGSNALYVYGSLTFDTMLCTTTGAINFAGTGGGDTIDFAGLSLSSALVFNGAGGDWTLQDDVTTTGTLTLTNGTLDTNNQDLDTADFIGDIAGTKTLTLGSSTWNIDDDWDLSQAGTTLNCGTSTIIIDAGTFTGGLKTYYEVQFTGTGGLIYDSCNFTNLSKTGAAIASDGFTLLADQTITGTLTLTGNSTDNRLRCKSNTSTHRIITAANTSVTNCDFYYIEGAGAGDWDFSSNPGGCGWSGGDCDGITFSSPIYWTRGTNGNFWGVSGGWAGSSGATYTTHFQPRADIGVVFDSNSPGVDVNMYSNTVDYVGSITFTGTPGAIELYNHSASMVVYIFGDLVIASNTTFDLTRDLDFRFIGGGTCNVDMKGVDSYECVFYASSGTTVSLTGDIYSTDADSALQSTTGGQIDTNDYTVEIDAISFGNATVNLGASEIYCQSFNTGSSSTMNAGTSTIYCNTFYGAGKTFYDVVIYEADSSAYINGTNTFNDLIIIGEDSSTARILFYADQLITNDLIITGYTATLSRIEVGSDTPGTQRTLYVNNGYALQYCDVRDIVAAGTTSPWDCSAGLNVDLGNNLYITFTPPTDCYWVGNSGNWTDVSHWASSSGGSGGTGRVPIGNDTAIFDAYSVTLPLQTISMNMPNVPSVNTLAIQNSPTFSASTIYVTGSLLLGDLTFSVTTVYFQGFTDHTLSSQNTITSALVIDKDPDTMPYIILGTDVTVSNSVTLLAGTLRLGVFTLTANNFVSSDTTDTRALDMDTGTFVVTSTGNKWNVVTTNMTVVDSPDSTIIFDSDVATACTFTGGGKGYGNFTIMGAGNYSTTISGTNSFNELTIDRSEANKTITGSVTCTILGMSIPLEGTNTVTITNTDFSMASGEFYGDYLIISGSTASGGALFWANAGGHSTNNGGNSGWIWTLPDPPTVVTLDPSDVSFLGERLNGQITDMGDYGILYCFFEYGPTTSYGFETDPMDTITGTGTFDFYLSPYKVYHYRAVAYFGLGIYEYGLDKVISLSGAVGQAEADLSGLDLNEGTPLIEDAPDEPGQMYDEGNTSGIPFADFLQDALDEADIPEEVFWYCIAFFIAIVIGFLVYGWTRSFIMQPIASALVMAAFVGGGTLGDGLLPFWTVLVFAIEATMVFIIQERQTA